jgi:hypothetical protein
MCFKLFLLVWDRYVAVTMQLSELETSDVFFTIFPSKSALDVVHFSKLELSLILAESGFQ